MIAVVMWMREDIRSIVCETPGGFQQGVIPAPGIKRRWGFRRTHVPGDDGIGARQHYCRQYPRQRQRSSEREQIARSSSYNSDKVNIGLTFTENGAPTCQSDQDALNAGFVLKLYEGECSDDLVTGLQATLNPFVVTTVNHESYGTLFQTYGPETVSARIVALPTPASPACGEWTLNLEVIGLDTESLDLAGTNPFALVLTTIDGDFAGCFNVTNAIVGNQIDPPSRTVRRGVRR
jgi:hypothetical protein